MATYIMGKDAKLYIGTAGAELAVMTEVDNVRDLKLNMEAGEADVTTRGSGGWREKKPTLREASAEFQMQWEPGDPAFESVRDAFLAGGEVELAILDQAKAVNGAQGLKGSFSIMSFSRDESLEESIKVDVTAALTDFDEWVEVGS